MLNVGNSLYDMIHMNVLDNHCYSCIWPSHCKDSHTLHIKSGSKLTQILNFKAKFHQEFELFSKKQNLC